MHKKIMPKKPEASRIGQFPHCDQRVLHAPGECEYCDKHPEWQELRHAWSIAFTGYEPDGKELPCPATYARGDTLNKWAGNRAKTSPPIEEFVNIIVAGQTVRVKIDKGMQFVDLTMRALSLGGRKAHTKHADWELRDNKGNLVGLGGHVDEYDLSTYQPFYFGPRAGVGG